MTADLTIIISQKAKLCISFSHCLNQDSQDVQDNLDNSLISKQNYPS